MNQEKGFILASKLEMIMPVLLQENLHLIMAVLVVLVIVVSVGIHANHVIVLGILVVAEVIAVVIVEGQLNNEF
jgi:hypothetical protein